MSLERDETAEYVICAKKVEFRSGRGVEDRGYVPIFMSEFEGVFQVDF